MVAQGAAQRNPGLTRKTMGSALERATEDRWNPALAQVSTAPGLGSIPLDSQGSAALLSPLRFTLGYNPSSLRD